MQCILPTLHGREGVSPAQGALACHLLAVQLCVSQLTALSLFLPRTTEVGPCLSPCTVKEMAVKRLLKGTTNCIYLFVYGLCAEVRE